MCPICKRDCGERSRFENHACEPINENVVVAIYQLRDETTYAHSLLKSLTKLQLAKFCTNEKYALSNLWPPISVPFSHRKLSAKYNYKNYCNPSTGAKILIGALKELYESGDSSGLIIHRNIDVMHGIDSIDPVCRIREHVSRPLHQELIVVPEGENYWRCTLNKPPKTSHPKPLDIQKNDRLVVFKMYGKGPKYLYPQHQWPPFLKSGHNLFLNPWMIDWKDLEHMTGLKLEAFWYLVDRLFFIGERDRRKINLPAAVLLARLVMRQNLSLQFLTNMFALKKIQIGNIFKCISISQYAAGNYICRMWTHPQTTDDVLDNYFDHVNSKVDNLHLQIISKFQDPKKLNRLPFVVCMDSKKFSIMKSSDLQYQKRTYYDKKNEHFITLTAMCTLDGTLINYSKPSGHFQASANSLC